MLGDHVADQDFSPGGRGGDHIGARLDLIGDDGVSAAVELFHAVDLDGIGTCAAHVGAHGVEEVCQIHDMGLSGGVLDDGPAGGQDRGDHDVHGCAHGDLVQIDPGAVQMSVQRIGVDEAVLHADLGPQGGHALHVLVNGAHAEIAAAGHGGLGAAEAAQHGADQIIGGPDLAHQIVGGVLISGVGAVDFNGRFIDIADPGAELGQDRQKHIGVADLGNIFNTAYAFHQQSCRNDGHRCVLGAADIHNAAQRSSAVDHILFHRIPFPRVC